MTTLIDAGLFAFFVKNCHINARKRQACRTGFRWRSIGQWRNHDSTGLSLPPGINDGQLLFTNIHMVPHPCLRIDWLTNWTKDTEAGKVIALGRSVTVTHERTYNSGCCVEGIDLEFLNDFPETIRSGVGWNAFKHNRSSAKPEGTIEDIGMSCNPTDISGTPVDIIIFHIKNVLTGVHGIGEISTSGMNNTLWLTGGTGGVEDKEDILSIHGFRLTGWSNTLGCYFIMPPAITSVCHGNIVSTTFYNNTVFDGITFA